jgi:hypothetical protein
MANQQETLINTFSELAKLSTQLQTNKTISPETISSINATLTQLSEAISELAQDETKYVGTKENTAKIVKISLKTLIDNLGRELERVKNIENSNVKKLRDIELNDYDGEKYSDQTMLLMMIAGTAIGVIIVCALSFVGLPQHFVFLLVGIVVVVGSYYIYDKYLDISARDNMNYQEYSWKNYDISGTQDPSQPQTNPWLPKQSCTCPN